MIVGLVEKVPTTVWAGLVVANTVLTAVTFPAARRRLRQAGQRQAGGESDQPVATAKDTVLTVASLIPAALFWAMVLAGSLHGLVAFGRDVLGWTRGWEYLVPGTLDGVSVTFAFLAFRAIRKHKAPDRCYRLVWGAALASATVNFTYEYAHSGHNLIAGGYLALLSVLGMAMFHEFLDQFEEGAAYIKRENPKFGLRWLTWPTNTFCSAVAWRNHPPAEGTTATVLNAVANLDRVRQVKRNAREERIARGHQQALDDLRRKSELASVAAVQGPADAAPISSGVPFPDTATADDRVRRPGQDTPMPVRAPLTASTVTQWVTTWIEMCADGHLIHGPLNDDEYARTRFDLSAKQLRNVRNAAMSGALRQRAETLGVTIPPEYVDCPPRPINGRVVAGAGA
jgi:hypothetical protein